MKNINIRLMKWLKKKEEEKKAKENEDIKKLSSIQLKEYKGWRSIGYGHKRAFLKALMNNR